MSLYPAPPPDALTSWGMVAITLVVMPAAAGVFSAGQGRAWRAWVAAGCFVMALGGGLAATGLLAQVGFKPPLLQTLMGLILIALVWRALRSRRQQATASPSIAALVLLQSFRLPLEVLMLHAATVGVMPVEFSMDGYNLDVFTGALALPLGLALWKAWRVPLAWIWAWNLWGMACLGALIVLAVMTSPQVAFFGADPAHISLWVLHFPYVWLPTVLVSVAIYGHLALSLRLRHLAKSGPAALAPSPSNRQRPLSP
jgi:hypothetical protein